MIIFSSNGSLTEGKRGKDGNKKFEYIENERRFSGEIKNIFLNFLGYHLIKKALKKVRGWFSDTQNLFMVRANGRKIIDIRCN